MFHLELVPLGYTFGPLKSDLGVFWPSRATDFIMGLLKIWDNFLGPQLPILKFTFWNPCAICDYLASTKKMGVFSGSDPSRTHVLSYPRASVCLSIFGLSFVVNDHHQYINAPKLYSRQSHYPPWSISRRLT